MTERSTMPGPGSDSHSPERSDSAVRLRAALKMGCSPQRRWKLFCSRQLPSGGGNVHFKARDPRPRWGPPASPCPHPDRDGWRSHGDAGSQKAGGEAESDPSASIHVQAELTLGEASRRAAPFVQPAGGGRGLHLGLEVVTQVWTYARQAVLVGPSLCVPSVNTESRRRGSGVAGTLRPSPACACLRRPPPRPPLASVFFSSYSASEHLLGTCVLTVLSSEGARTRSFIWLLFWCLALWEPGQPAK